MKNDAVDVYIYMQANEGANCCWNGLNLIQTTAVNQAKLKQAIYIDEENVPEDHFMVRVSRLQEEMD